MQGAPIHCIVEGLVDEAAVRRVFVENDVTTLREMGGGSEVSLNCAPVAIGQVVCGTPAWISTLPHRLSFPTIGGGSVSEVPTATVSYSAAT